MCIARNDIKLCTCSIGNEKPANYWVLYRFEESDGSEIIGEAVMPYPMKGYEITESNILQTLNEKDCFDKLMNLSSKDRREINMDKKGKFVFEYNNGRWVVADKSDAFWAENSYGEIETGIIDTLNQKD